MGHRHSRPPPPPPPPTIHYVQKPQVTQQLQQSKQQVQKLNNTITQIQTNHNQVEKQVSVLKNPVHYQAAKEIVFKSFVDNVYKLNFTDKIPKQNGDRNFIVIGNISAGKTSLINYVFGLKLPVGLGDTTRQVCKVASSEDGKTHIWDAPGINQHFSLFTAENLSFFHCADRVFILYPDSPKVIQQVITLIHKIKPKNTYLVRTKCDCYDASHRKTIEQEIQTDKQEMMKWGVNVPVLACSTKKDINFKNNKQIKQLLNGSK